MGSPIVLSPFIRLLSSSMAVMALPDKCLFNVHSMSSDNGGRNEKDEEIEKIHKHFVSIIAIRETGVQQLNMVLSLYCICNCAATTETI